MEMRWAEHQRKLLEPGSWLPGLVTPPLASPRKVSTPSFTIRTLQLRSIPAHLPPESPRKPSTGTHTTMALASRCCSRLARTAVASPALRLAPTAAHPRRWNSAAAAANPKISDIVDKISGLTLLETADLVSLLKVPTIPPRLHPPPTYPTMNVSIASQHH